MACLSMRLCDRCICLHPRHLFSWRTCLGGPANHVSCREWREVLFSPEGNSQPTRRRQGFGGCALLRATQSFQYVRRLFLQLATRQLPRRRRFDGVDPSGRRALPLRISVLQFDNVFPPHSNEAKGWRHLSRWTRVLRAHFNRRRSAAGFEMGGSGGASSRLGS